MNLHHTVWIPNRIQDKEWSKCTKNNENLKIDDLVPNISEMYNKSDKYKNIVTFGIGSCLL